MKIFLRLIGVLLVSCGLSGCFQIDQVITLAPDGSGTLEETFLISRRIADSMSALTGGMDEQQGAENTGKSSGSRSFFKDDEIKKKAESFGVGVRFVRMERISGQKFEGYKALYSFKDINKLRIDQSSGSLSGQTGRGSEPLRAGTEFAFTPGKVSSLTVTQQKSRPDPVEKASEPSPPPKESGPEELAMVRQMFDGLRISTTLILRGTVVESNATHLNGSTITLAEIDFGKILDKPELLAKMAAIPPGDQAAALEMIKALPGMKVDMNDILKVSFK